MGLEGSILEAQPAVYAALFWVKHLSGPGGAFFSPCAVSKSSQDRVGLTGSAGFMAVCTGAGIFLLNASALACRKRAVTDSLTGFEQLQVRKATEQELATQLDAAAAVWDELW